MTETDDIVAALRAWAPLVASGYTVPAAGQVMENAATAITERDAQIERLTRERDEALRSMSEWARRAGAAEGRLNVSEWPAAVEGWRERAATAERERDEARAEVERKDAALRRIERWYGEFPETGEQWADGTQMSYSACFGSNGERDYMRAVARAALTKGGENGQS